MSVTIQPIIDEQIRSLISAVAEGTLHPKKLEVYDWCQSMSTEVWGGRVDGKLVCLWGLIPPSLISQQAYLWMHATDAIHEHKFLFVRHSQRVVEKMLERYSPIIGHCQIGADHSIRWVRWLGGVFSEPEGPYLPFRIERRSHG